MVTEEELIQQILSKNPEVKRNQILEDLETEKTKTAGLIANATLLRLIAARYGVQNLQNRDFDRRLSISKLIPGLNDATVVGRVVAIYPPKTFEGKKPGKIASLMVFDDDGIIRVVLWNDKADLIETEKLKVGHIARFAHGYTREDRNGKTELHIGEKSEIEIRPEGEKEDGHFVCKFATKIKDITTTQNNIHLQGTVKKLSPSTNFKNEVRTGTVLHFSLADETGEIPIVVWNEKAEEVEKILRTNANVQLINARVKAAQNGQFEIHVDSYTYVDVSNAAPQQLTKIGLLNDESGSVNVEGVTSILPVNKKVTTSKGETVNLTVFDIKDETGSVRVSAWRNHANEVSRLKVGDSVRLENIFAKKAGGGVIELSTGNATVISIRKA